MFDFFHICLLLLLITLNHFRIICRPHDPLPPNNSVSTKNVLLHNPSMIFKFRKFNIHTKLLFNKLSISFSNYNNVLSGIFVCLCDQLSYPESCIVFIYVSLVFLNQVHFFSLSFFMTLTF